MYLHRELPAVFPITLCSHISNAFVCDRETMKACRRKIEGIETSTDFLF